jgi:hypothetical protein
MKKKAEPAKKKKYWVRHVQQTSFAMKIPAGLFKRTPRGVALGLKRAVLASSNTKGTKFQSAMSMLNFYINRGGKGLKVEDKKRLEEAKVELRKLFGRE